MQSGFFVKEWYILLEGQREGPFSPSELRSDPRVNPDTLVWKEGLQAWQPIRSVQELKDLFKDSTELHSPSPDAIGEVGEGDATLVLSEDFNESKLAAPPFWWWLLVIATILIWAWYGQQ